MRNETTIGEATILQGNKPLDWYLRNQQMQAQNAYRQAQWERAAEQQRNREYNDLMKIDFSKPGQFQKDETVNEINAVKNETRERFYKNPHTTRGEVELEMGPKRDAAEARLQRRTMFDTEFAKYQAMVKANPKRYNADPNSGLPAVIQQTFKDASGRNIDIDQLEPEQVTQVFNSPAVVNPDVRTTDAIEDLKGRFARQEMGPEQMSALGFFREGAMNKARFMTVNERGEQVPGISDSLIEYVMSVDPSIADGYRWQMAREQAKGAGLNPNDIRAVQEIYADPKFQADTEGAVQDRIRGALEMHQQVEHRKIIQRTGTRQKDQGFGNDNVTEDDYRKVFDQIKGVTRLGEKIKEQADKIKTAAKDGKGNEADATADYEQFLKSKEVQDIAKTIKSGKYNGMFVQEVEPVVKENRPGLNVIVKVGTQTGADYTKATANEPVFVPLDDIPTLFELLKNNYSERKAKQMNWNTFEDYKNKRESEASDLGLDEKKPTKKKKTEADNLGLN